MNRMYLRAFVATLCIVVAGQCQAQELELSFDGSCGTAATLAPGAVQAVSIDCVLTTSNNPLDSGAQGWSISVASRGGSITSITTDGTAAATTDNGGLRGVGFEKSETTSDSGVATGGNNNLSLIHI